MYVKKILTTWRIIHVLIHQQNTSFYYLGNLLSSRKWRRIMALRIISDVCCCSCWKVGMVLIAGKTLELDVEKGVLEAKLWKNCGTVEVLIAALSGSWRGYVSIKDFSFCLIEFSTSAIVETDPTALIQFLRFHISKNGFTVTASSWIWLLLSLLGTV